MMVSMQKVILGVGLDTQKFLGNWESTETGIKHLLNSKELLSMTLEVFKANSDTLVTRWDFSVTYNQIADGEGSFWLDPDVIRHAIEKCNISPKQCDYRIVFFVKEGCKPPPGWSHTKALSTAGFVQQSLGTTISANSLETQTQYWRKAS